MLRKDYDWVLWVDIDTLFMNMDLALERFLDNRYDMIVSRNAQGANAGIFLVRVSLCSCYCLNRAILTAAEYGLDTKFSQSLVVSNKIYSVRLYFHWKKKKREWRPTCVEIYDAIFC